MAEVFLGEATSVQGFKKRVAIKRVLPHLASQQNFIGMFLDEARLGARLNHANIVSVSDIGSADNTFFIVMEFVDGCNLKAVTEALQAKNQQMPLQVAIYIAIEACRALSYAHELHDEDGNPIDLVHRDVSPPNILISQRGEVKLTDFGLAKARTQLERTDPGVVKGKFSYLSPEVVSGAAVDARADLFALGVCIWEMLSGKRLFLGETDYDTVQLVHKAEVPTLVGLHSDVDETFDALLMRALAKNPKDRFQSARQFGDELAGYLFSHQLKVTSYDLANLVRVSLEREKSIPPQPTVINRLIQEELGRFTSLENSPAIDFDPMSIALSPDEDAGRPLDSSRFENPADWFSGDSEIESAITHATKGQEAENDMAWLEFGFDDGGGSGGDDDMTRRVELKREQSGALPLDELAGGPPPLPGTPPPTPPKAPAHFSKPSPAERKANSNRGVALAVAGMLCLGVLAAAAYFLFLKP